jgi:F0F1-type ATP synthase membrane subunit c/vacuolar-type H+-ATPase subunit K
LRRRIPVLSALLMKRKGSIGLGLAIGVAIGAALGNVTAGIGIGIALAIAMGALGRPPDEPE